MGFLWQAFPFSLSPTPLIFSRLPRSPSPSPITPATQANVRITTLPVSHFDNQEKQAQPYSGFPRKYYFPEKQIRSRAYIDIEVSKYHKIYFLAMGFEDIRGKLQNIAKSEMLRALVFSSNR